MERRCSPRPDQQSAESSILVSRSSQPQAESISIKCRGRMPTSPLEFVSHVHAFWWGWWQERFPAGRKRPC